MRPKPILWFERALLAAIAIDLVNNFLSREIVVRGFAMRGLVLGQPALIALICAAPGIGLILWYCIARRASVIAKWLLAVFVALAVVIFFRQMTVTPLTKATPMLIAAVSAELLKLFALLCLFLPSAQPWFGKEDDVILEEDDAAFRGEDIV